MQETLALVEEKIQTGEQVHHVVVNAGKVVALQKDPELRHSVNQSHIINADGQAVVWASRFLGKPLKERVAGIDLMASLVEMAHKNNNKISKSPMIWNMWGYSSWRCRVHRAKHFLPEFRSNGPGTP